MISIAAAADGYQYTLNGNVIANQGFIDHVGFVDSNGEYSLNSNYTALWGAMQSLGQLVGMVFLNPISDTIGRKMTMYVLWVVLAGVSWTFYPIWLVARRSLTTASLSLLRHSYVTGRTGPVPRFWLALVLEPYSQRFRCTSLNGHPATFVVVLF